MVHLLTMYTVTTGLIPTQVGRSILLPNEPDRYFIRLVCFGDMIGVHGDRPMPVGTETNTGPQYFAAPNTLAYEVCQVLISRGTLPSMSCVDMVTNQCC